MQRRIADNFLLAMVLLSICSLMLGLLCVYLLMLVVALCQFATDAFALMGGSYG